MLSSGQTWTLIGLLASMMLGVLGIVITSVRGDIAGLRVTMDSRFAAMDSRFASFEVVMDARFTGLEDRFDRLDRDVQVLYERFPRGA